MTPPNIGQKFIDEEGTLWTVEDVTHSAQLEGFFIVRISFPREAPHGKETLVLTAREFLALCRDRQFRDAQEGANN